MERIKAVVLDDERHVVNLIKALVPWSELGIEFSGEAYNGVDGTELIKEVHPDIVIRLKDCLSKHGNSATACPSFSRPDLSIPRRSV